MREQEEDPCPQRRRTKAGPLLRVEEEGTSVYEHRAKGNEDVHEGLSGRLRGLLFSGRVDGMGALHERWNRRTHLLAYKQIFELERFKCSQVFTMVLVRLSIPALLLLATKLSTAASASACAPFCVFADIFGAGAPPYYVTYKKRARPVNMKHSVY